MGLFAETFCLPTLSRYGENGLRAVFSFRARQTLDETRWLLELAKPILSFSEWWAGSIYARLDYVWNCNPSQRTASSSEFARCTERSRTTPATTRFLAWDLHAGRIRPCYDILIYTKHLPIAVKFVSDFRVSVLSWTIWRNRQSEGRGKTIGRMDSSTRCVSERLRQSVRLGHRSRLSGVDA